MNLKTKWSKYPIQDKLIIIFFFLGLFFLISGIIMLISISIGVIFNGFNVLYNNGVIGALEFYEPNNLLNIIFLKIGVVFVFFLMPVFSFTSIIWFITIKLSNR